MFSPLVDVLRVGNYRVYTAGNAVSLIGTWVQRIATGWLTWELTESGAWLGAIAFADLAPTVLIGPLGGAVADRADQLRLTRISQIILLALAATLFGLTAAGRIGILSLLLLTLASGTVAAFNQPARLALISSLVPQDKLPAAVAMNSIVFNVARFVGPAVAGVAIAASGVEFAFAINAASYLVFLVALSRVRLERAAGAPRARIGLIADLLEGFRHAARHAGLSAVFVLMIVTCVGGRPVVELLPGFADAVFAAGPRGLAVLTSAIGLGAIVGGLWLGSRPDPRRLPDLAVFSAALLSVSILTFVATAALWSAALAMIVCGFAVACAGISSQTIIHLAVAPRMRARILSIHGIIFRGCPALGALAMGVASEFWGLRPPLAAGALLILLTAFWMLTRLQAVRASLHIGGAPTA